ncbi:MULTISPECIES: aldehyde dehydrogenase family protein [Streptomycetaceae]|uniref:Aldehyde dehydrogenase n=1 Tax=Streptantibioticus cattleyicolor (strain ATCC 35852 / DSM 46488 / JCM 4925 / NBRC 14057 / NRRL 8057) TaxID=1003195 RepID=F8JZ61_STREN|nr:aldehyde dehydrogenase family protein [Streptantibioticus cattleyicolor]AEW94727.1 aldehyde dehydrogenase [Streptantibioticus cattleyicolor NRRL 8057 = DSM 46488]MYS59358.1 aldehyde dehydrogenase family protein [Streptomyces sp. SID5468]CCB75083.1 putative aldehyde dehydrogenase [Streptantibioticus cattleyicolor NRRL 8057 = DSM 46488]
MTGRPAPANPTAAEAAARIHGHWIDGSWQRPGGGHYPVVDPATERVVGHAPQATEGDVDAAVRAARDAWPAWSRTAPERRAAVLARAAELLAERAAGLVPLVQAETGATIRVAATMQVPTAAERFRRYARGATEPDTVPLAPVPVKASPLAPGGLIGAAAVRRPVGVVACVTSYNFPLVNLAGKAAPALAMGNTVVAKPAPQDPLSCLLLGELLKEAGLPDGVFNVVTGAGAATGEALVAHPGVDMISFTGSTSVGKAIAVTAGRTMKRTLMELGGKGAAIVMEDVPEVGLKSAIGAVGSTWSFHSGQICTAPTRVLVHRALYEKVVTSLQHYAESLTIGDPVDNSTIVGPLISAAQRDRVEAYVAGARDQGARVVTGGTRPAVTPGYYVAPTLITDASLEMTVAQEEIFGPVVVAIPFDTEDEAVAVANGTPYGLYDYVFSRDAGRAWALAARLRSGNVGINTVQRHPETPFGGFKDSGVGRDGGSFGLHAYSELQSVVWPS